MKQVLVMILGVLVLNGCGRGLTGPAGATGASGTNGVNGSGCSVSSLGVTLQTPNGGSLISCGDGTSSLVLNGAKGSTGATGQAGSAGSVITPVNFCTGKSSYPNTFVENGFCLNNKLYAVYSLYDGFLTEVPPGTYTSQGVNSTCNFVITANCGVQTL